VPMPRAAEWERRVAEQVERFRTEQGQPGEAA
jgi:hypothetical protein